MIALRKLLASGAFALAPGSSSSAFNVALAPGYQPILGDVFTVLTYGSANAATTRCTVAASK